MMTLKQISFAHIGPFKEGDVITFEPDLTVITGRNDVGKSILLDILFQLMTWGRSSAIREEQVAFSERLAPTMRWEDDDRIVARVVMSAEGSQGGGDIQALYTLAPSRWGIAWEGKFLLDGNRRNAANDYGSLTGRPSAIKIEANSPDSIRSEIPLDSMHPREAALMRLAFGRDIDAGEFGKLPKLQKRQAIKRAEDELNRRLNSFLPSTLQYHFILEPPTNEHPIIEIGLLDEQQGFGPIHLRGAGIRKLINLLATLAVENIGHKPVILLLDEPENSLHSDAQHALRFALEELSQYSNIQVIYSTHSSAMINPLRTETIRLLSRIEEDGHAFTTFDNAPVGDNFATVRTSLGITPTDSLLLAPITIFVEGQSEARCLPLLLQRLEESEMEGFSDVSSLLGSCLFVAVGGDSFSSQCTLAKAFDIVPIVYADGDKAKQARQQLQRHHSDVPLITPADANQELEDLISRSVYFDALAEYLQKSKDEISEEMFSKWESKAKLPAQMLFSKRVARWVEDSFDANFSGKPAIMALASKSVPPQEIKAESFSRLMSAVRAAVSSCVTGIST